MDLHSLMVVEPSQFGKIQKLVAYHLGKQPDPRLIAQLSDLVDLLKSEDVLQPWVRDGDVMAVRTYCLELETLAQRNQFRPMNQEKYREAKDNATNMRTWKAANPDV